ncbi:MAG: hypothetical protein ACREV9_08630 [Burkholderiales bacterium]
MPIASNEQLARFILFSKWIRSSEPVKTVKPDAFIPHPYPDLSVTRHKNLSEQKLWRIGQDIASARPATLYGRADIRAAEVRRQSLHVEPQPVANNPNHASVIGWPADKPAQKIIAQELAAKANFVPKPPPARS